MPVRIVPVETSREVSTFIDLPWSIYRNSPLWVPPLKKEIRHLLDKDRHPFWRRSKQALYLAFSGDTCVGRVAGIIDGAYNEFHDEKSASFGFFECVNDRDTARALFDAVASWARENSCDLLRGPLNPSTNYEAGLLVSGFEQAPVFMFPYNPEYYQHLVLDYGFEKAMDLLCRRVVRGFQVKPWIAKMAAKIEKKGNFELFHAKPGHVKEQLDSIKNIYVRAWEENWGYSPISDDEFYLMADQLEQILDPELLIFISVNKEIVGFTLLIRDINPLLRHFNGAIGLSGIFKYFLYRRQVKGLRCLLFGVKREYRNIGIPLVLINRLVEVLPKKIEYDYLELGWTLENNRSINSWIEKMEMPVSVRHRVYEKAL